MSSYRPDPIRIDDVNHPTVLDRTVTLAMRMQDPNVAVVDDFLSAEECASLIALAADRVKRSVVVSDTAGENEVHASRTSEGTWFPKGEQALVTLIEQRIEALTGIPAENGEGLQVLSYGPGAEYRAHHDYFSVQSVGGRAHIGAAGQRIATLVLYLNDVEDGGDTAFPDLRLSVKPRAGRALYFEFHNAAGQVDPRCLHAGMPVKAGRKWIATKWYRQSRWG
ncbi:MAG: 2OG-Fe(II) oxygenase [Burkholderiaceae bacterium]